MITDLGPEFIARVFKKTAGRLGAQARYAAADSIHATACLERFWLTVKQTARFNLLFAPIDRAEMERWREHGSLGTLWMSGRLGGTRW